MPHTSTLLSIEAVGFPPYSVRGLSQTLEPIGASVQLRRTINGNLRDVSDPLMRKYSSSISGDDQEPPAFDGVWPGLTVTVHCIQELVATEEAAELPTDFEGVTETPTEPVELPTSANLGRPHVPGSIRRRGGFIFYRPILEMLIRDFDLDRDEWGAVQRWRLQLEEI